MKRFAGVLLLLALLCGCADNTPNETAPTPPTADASQQEGTLLQRFSLQDYAPLAVIPLGHDLLLVDCNRLTILDGTDLTVILSQPVIGLPTPDTGFLWTRGDNVAYYHEGSNKLIFLGSNLQQTRSLALPEDLVGGAWLSPDWNTVYYATQSAIRALDLRTGTSRLLKEQGASWQSISGVFFNGTALRCEAEQADGSVRISLISTQNGALIEEDTALRTLVAPGDGYFLSRSDTCVPQLIYGKLGQSPQELWPQNEPDAWFPLTEAGILVTVRDTAVQTVLACYCMDTGKQLSEIFLREKVAVAGISADEDGILWFYSDDTLFRWDTALPGSADGQCYCAALHTRENPDKTGLAEVEAAAQLLEQRYGIDIVFGEDAAALMPSDYSFETEYIPQAYQKALSVLTDALGQFPDNFFTLAAERSPGKKLTVVLVRNIYSAASPTVLSSADGVQYWQAGDPCIALSLTGDLYQTFFHDMGHVIDSRVLSTCAAFYEWHRFNPAGFRYDKDYISNLNRDPSQYLTGDDRWFIDTYSMSFEIEDRSRIFEYASQPGNEAFFASSHMQTKLKQICSGIRQAFGLKNDPRQFVWEQYLKK